jgi:uncharacterized protein YcbK (DUF882 family)
VFLHHAIVSIPTTAVAFILSLIAHRMALIGLLIFAGIAGTTQAAAEDRALKLFFTHTGEKATIVFKRNGKFDPKGLAQINRFLRDWRKNEPTKMDPKLLDLVWEVYQRSGAKESIHVVSAYRSPSTNNMLRSRSRNTGVAKRSQHMLGKAMDFYIPGVKLATLRSLAMQIQAGGVGYYPTSGSPFVHLDVGNVRAWPRMSRQELARLFPDGRTLHLPADGRALPGYDLALADQKQRVRTRTIEIARNTGEDDEAGTDTPSVDLPSRLVTAMLPTPRSRARDGLAMQLEAKPTVEDAGKSKMPDLASLAIPLPTFRPQVDSMTVASVPPKAPPVMLASLVIGKSATGALQITSQGRGIATSQLAPMAPAPSPLATTLPQLSAGVGATSTKALIAWALRAPGTAMEMTAPRLHGVGFDEDPDADDEDFDLVDDEFDTERFAIDG